MKITLLTEDKVFGEMLYHYINNNYLGRISLSLITDVKLFDNFDSAQSDLVIWDTNRDVRDDRYVYIVEHKPKGSNEIYKYQPADEIITKAINAVDVDIRPRSISTKPSKLISCLSSTGGAKCDRDILDICKELSNNGRVVFLSLEDIDSTGFFFGIDDVTTMDLLRLDDLIVDRSKSIAIDSYIATDVVTGIDYLKYPISSHYLYDISTESLREVIDMLRNTNKYSYIVLNLSSNIGKRNIDIFTISKHILVLGDNEDELAIYKRERLYRELKLLDDRYGYGLLDRCISISNDIRGFLEAI